MMNEYGGSYQALDFAGIKRYPLGGRVSKVSVDRFCDPGAFPFPAGVAECLPDILKGTELRELLDRLEAAVRGKREVIVALGAHVLKCGLGPLLVELLRAGVVTHLAFNGAGAIHDFEIAAAGRTSEEVADGIVDGTFGMAEETGAFVNGAAAVAQRDRCGFGEAIGREFERRLVGGRERSVIYNAWRCHVPATVHVAIGTDIVHVHPDFDPAATGAASGTDFRVYAASVARLREGSVYLNLGSAVVLPEVFLKALTAARNLGHPAFGFATANFDMKEQYRPRENVLSRPALGGGHAYGFVGHHEILLPLLFGMLLERLRSK